MIKEKLWFYVSPYKCKSKTRTVVILMMPELLLFVWTLGGILRSQKDLCTVYSQALSDSTLQVCYHSITWHSQSMEFGILYRCANNCASQAHLTQPASDQLHIGCWPAELLFKIRVQNFDVCGCIYSAKRNQPIKCLLSPRQSGTPRLLRGSLSIADWLCPEHLTHNFKSLLGPLWCACGIKTWELLPVRCAFSSFFSPRYKVCEQYQSYMAIICVMPSKLNFRACISYTWNMKVM